MALTAKQEAFCQAIAGGSTQADAYRFAYDADNMTDAVVYVKASELMANGNISVRVTELKEELAAKLLWTRTDSVKKLIKAFDICEKPLEIVGIVKTLNEMHGYNAPIKTENNTNVNTRTLDSFYGSEP